VLASKISRLETEEPPQAFGTPRATQLRTQESHRMSQQIGGDSSQNPRSRMIRIPFTILLLRKAITASVCLNSTRNIL